MTSLRPRATVAWRPLALTEPTNKVGGPPESGQLPDSSKLMGRRCVYRRLAMESRTAARPLTMVVDCTTRRNDQVQAGRPNRPRKDRGVLTDRPLGWGLRCNAIQGMGPGAQKRIVLPSPTRLWVKHAPSCSIPSEAGSLTSALTAFAKRNIHTGSAVRTSWPLEQSRQAGRRLFHACFRDSQPPSGNHCAVTRVCHRHLQFSTTHKRFIFFLCLFPQSRNLEKRRLYGIAIVSQPSTTCSRRR